MSSSSPVDDLVVFHLQLLNITSGVSRPLSEQKLPVDITFAVRDGRGYLPGSEVSEHLRKLSLVEFSFYVGFPTVQIAERTSHTLRSGVCCTQVRVVLTPSLSVLSLSLPRAQHLAPPALHLGSHR